MKGKKGMEMWQLILIVLAVILLIFVVAWFYALSQGADGLLDKLGGLFG